MHRDRRVAPPELCSFLWRKLDLDFTRNGLSNFGLQREYVSQIPFIAFSPQMRLLHRVNELRGDAHTRSNAQHSSFNYRVYVQFPRNFPKRPMDSLVLHRRGTRDHSQVANFGQDRDQGLVGLARSAKYSRSGSRDKSSRGRTARDLILGKSHSVFPMKR